MRGSSGSRASTAVAVVAATVAVLAVTVFPGLSFADIQGGSPSDVFTQTLPDTCLTAGPNGETAMGQAFTLDAESNVLVYFTFAWGRLNANEEGLIMIGLDGEEGPFEWGFPGNNTTTRTSGTVMWTFDNVSGGEHRVDAFARVDVIPSGSRGGAPPVADVNGCALTVFVIPPAA